MPNVVTPFTRERDTPAEPPSTPPRHRRDGYFDDSDQWHDSMEAMEPARHAQG
jgi:hypothetical protein